AGRSIVTYPSFRRRLPKVESFAHLGRERHVQRACKSIAPAFVCEERHGSAVAYTYRESESCFPTAEPLPGDDGSFALARRAHDALHVCKTHPKHQRTRAQAA